MALYSYILTIASATDANQQRWLNALGYLAAFSVAVMVALRSSKVVSIEKLAWSLYGLFALFWSATIWVEDIAFLRALTEFCVLGATIVMGGPRWLRALTLAGSLVMWWTVSRSLLLVP